MVLCMTRPTKRPESAFHQFKKRVPSDIAAKARGKPLTLTFPDAPAHDGFAVTIRVGDVVKLSLRTREPALAKLRSALAEQQLQHAWEAIRKGPKPLTHKQVVALSGRLYRAFADACDSDPGSAELWQSILRENEAASNGELAKLAVVIGTDDQARQRWALERRFGGFADHLLGEEGLVIDDDSRVALLREADRALNDAARRLARKAEGDYTPDAAANRFPDWVGRNEGAQGRVSLWSLFAGWEKEAKRRELARSTFRDYESRWRMFSAWLGHDDALRVKPEDIVRYKDHRLDSGVSLKTVNSSDLNALKAIFGWAVENRLLPSNPAQGVRAKGKRKIRERELHFTPDEVRAILSLARDYRSENPKEMASTAAAKRWLPWLCAYSGARIGEVAQLRKKDIVREGGAWVMRLTPEADTMKDGSFRVVPLHAHLVEQGFIKFVEGSGEGYLFFRAKDAKEASDRKKSVCNRLRDFVRGAVKDKRIRPNHGWGHTFKARALEAGLSDKVADAICGHGVRAVADYYRAATLVARVNFMQHYPRYEIVS